RLGPADELRGPLGCRVAPSGLRAVVVVNVALAIVASVFHLDDLPGQLVLANACFPLRLSFFPGGSLMLQSLLDVANAEQHLGPLPLLGERVGRDGGLVRVV